MKDSKLYAYYFPNWHVDEKNEKWHGPGWTEWRVAQYATPRFEGHDQPKIPLWGYEDESDPGIMAKKIAAAKKSGIDGFIFDWYWHTDGPYRKKCLENGFLKAENNRDFEFAVMWCNHTAGQLHPTALTPIGVPTAHSTATRELFFEITQYCIDNYFGCDNYIKLNGKPYFSLYLPISFVNQLGETEAKAAMDDFRERTVKAGFAGLHLNICSTWWEKPNGMSIDERNALIDLLGADSVSKYNWDFDQKPLTVDWADALELSKKTYIEDCAVKVPVIPTVVNGWDPSPRTVQSEVYTVGKYPFTPIGINATPELLERSLREFYELMKKNGTNMMTITSWNEWTEGNYLEPDTTYGYGMLDAVGRFTDYISKK